VKDAQALANDPTEVEIQPDYLPARPHRYLSLGQYKSLREVRFLASTLISTILHHPPETIKDYVHDVLSGLASPPFSNVVVTYGMFDFYGSSLGGTRNGSEED